MSNKEVWEGEYQKPTFLTLMDQPNRELVKFLRWLKKQKVLVEHWQILEVGSGTGRNVNYLVEQGHQAIGLELSKNAVKLARSRGEGEYREHDIGTEYPFADQEFDLVLDITSSNSLNEKEREVYLREVARVLKPGGWFFVRALCKDGDKNAHNLLKNSPGREKDTYVMPNLGLTERVFSKADFMELYGKSFKIEKLERTAHYVTFNNQPYKRQYWVAYLSKS